MVRRRFQGTHHHHREGEQSLKAQPPAYREGKKFTILVTFCETLELRSLLRRQKEVC
jgi:hypothetical protein